MAISAELQREYKRTMERANKRLYRIEQAAKEPGYEAITQYAYKNAVRDIQAMGGGKRFSKSMPQTMREYRKRMNAMNRFLDKPTSTKTGIKQVYEKRQKTFAKHAGEDVDWQGMAKIFETGLWQTLTAFFESKTAQKLVGRIQKDKEKLREQLKAGEAIRFNQYSIYGRQLQSEFESNEALSEMLTRYLNGAG